MTGDRRSGDRLFDRGSSANGGGGVTDDAEVSAPPPAAPTSVTSPAPARSVQPPSAAAGPAEAGWTVAISTHEEVASHDRDAAADVATTVAPDDDPDYPDDDAPVGGIRRWEARTDDLDTASRRPEALPERAQVGEDEQARDRRGRWYEVPVMLVLAFTLAFLLRTFVVQVFWIPSGSMIPTLEINDRIAAEKITYLWRDIERGEVVVFAGDEPQADVDMSNGREALTRVGQFLGVVPIEKDFVKRIIGLPGDTVEIVDGQVIVNGVALDEPYAILDGSNGVYEVPEGQMFVLGDNRPNSSDSRASLGFVDVDEVVGRAVAKIWPLDRVGSVEGVDWASIPDPN